jgi:hypothetical protein
MKRYKVGSVGPDGRRPVVTEDGRVVARITCDIGPAMLGWVTVDRLLELAGPWDWSVFLLADSEDEEHWLT